MEPGRVARQCCEPGLEYQSEKVVGILAQNTVRLRFGERNGANDFPDPAHVVALVGVERSEHLIGGQRHRSEELDAIDLSGLDIALNDLLEVDNQVLDGANYSYVGVDANHNGQFDEGEFAIAVKMAPGSTLHASDFVF